MYNVATCCILATCLQRVAYLQRVDVIVKTCNHANSLNKITIDIDFEACYNVITMNETNRVGPYKFKKKRGDPK